MFSHVTIGTNDLNRAAPFYDAVLSPLGIERLPGNFGKWIAWWRPDEGITLWVGQRWLGFPLQRFGLDKWLSHRLIGTSCWRRGLVQGGRSPTGAGPRRQ